MSLRTALKALFGTSWHVQGDNIIDGMTVAADGTAEAGKPLITDSNNAINGVTIAEIVRAADVSARIVNATAATLAIVEATHEGKTIVLSKVDGLAVTLPAATGGGAKYRFVIGLATTSVGYSVASAPTTDIFAGVAWGKDGDGDPANAWASASDTNKITLGGASLATGGAVGDVIEVEDVKAGLWATKVIITQGGTEATPFSHV